MYFRSLFAALFLFSIPSAAFAQIEPGLLADAERGDANAQYFLGFMYANGKDVPKNDIEAVRLFRLAAEQGLADAQYALGFMYANGEGVPQNYTEAVKWFRLAAQQGYAEAQSNLSLTYAKGEGVLQNFVKAHAWMSMAAAQGNEKASKNKDSVTKIMTRQQIAEAQAYAARCFENDYKGCN